MSAPHRSSASSEAGNPIGFGRMLRKEDARFLRGRGNYLDDVQLPGMLHGAILASPYAHARIVSIDTSAAEAHPKVKAVITGAMLDGLKLAWMPTLSADVQAVLATDKVRYQGQEVAFVIAEDRYSARDALELIDVEYEPLPPMIDARKALDADAPLVRDEIEGKTDNHIFDWEAGDKAATDKAFAGRRRHRRPRHDLPALAPGADGDVRVGRLDGPGHRQADRLHHEPGAARPPHRVRPRRRHPRAQDPGHLAGHRRRLRQQGADLPRLRAGRRRLDRHQAAGEVDGGPQLEPDDDRVRPRLPHARRDRRDAATARSSASRSTCSPTTARSTPRRSRRSTRPGSSTSSPARTTTARRTARSPACTRTRRQAAWPTPARSASPRRCT